jgi:hypothetical protein
MTSIKGLVEYLPIECDRFGNAFLPKHLSLDSTFTFHDVDNIRSILGFEKSSENISLRDIIIMLNRAIVMNPSFSDIASRPQSISTNSVLATELYLRNLLFDFCLAILAGDIFDGKLYLAHVMNCLGIDRRLVLLLSTIVTEPILKDCDVQSLLINFAKICEPANVNRYFDESNGFHSRYCAYLEHIK